MNICFRLFVGVLRVSSCLPFAGHWWINSVLLGCIETLCVGRLVSRGADIGVFVCFSLDFDKVVSSGSFDLKHYCVCVDGSV